MESRETFYPNWIIEAKKSVGKAKEWKKFIGELQGAVDQHLRENHIPSFADLAPAERLLFVERASKSLQSGTSYDQLYSHVSHMLDQQANNTVAKDMLSESTTLENTKTELISELVKDGAVSILKRWPEMKTKLHMFLNIPIPEKLRSMSWTYFMSDPRARKEYLDKLMKEPKKAISEQDQLISETCENMLRIQNTFPDIGPPTIGSFFAMKAVLSYFHAQLKTREELHHVYYLLILPMLHVLSVHISKTKPAANSVVAVLMEMYLTFIKDLPKYVGDIKNEYGTELKMFTDKVAEHLVDYDRSTKGSMSNYIAGLPQTAQREGEVTIDSTVILAMLSEVLAEVISPLIMSLFVGFLNKDALIYLWDQYVIGSDVAGYHMFLLPAFTATLLILLADDIFECRNVTELISTVQRESCKVNIRLIQAKMRSLHYKTLYAELNQDDKAAVPAIDPTRVGERNWSHWSNAVIPERTGVQQKQQAREARQAERERLLRLRREEEVKAQLYDTRRYADSRERSLTGEDRDALERQLEEERKHRKQKDKAYEQELSSLRREIEELKGHPPVERSPSVRSFESAKAPPPSRASADYIPPVPEVTVSKGPTAASIILDIVSAVSNKYRKVGHAEGREGEKLNELTKNFIREHEEDRKQAEIEVFGKALKPGEFEALKEPGKTNKGNKVKVASTKRFEDRWVAQS